MADFAKIYDALSASVQVKYMLHDHSKDNILPLDVADSLRTSVLKCLRIYQNLAFKAEAVTGQLLWNMPTKFHWLYHLSMRAKFLNPRKGSTWIEEAFVGKLKTMVHSCGAGSSQSQAIVKTAAKYRWVLHVIAADLCAD